MDVREEHIAWMKRGGFVLALAIGGYVAMRYSNIKSRQQHGETQLKALLYEISNCVAKHAAERNGQVPPSGYPVPEQLSSTHGEGYSPSSEDLTEAPYACNVFRGKIPLVAQVQWIRTDDKAGRVFAQVDTDEDGVSDIWFEAPVRCTPDCVVPNYFFTVDEDGLRTPPALSEGEEYLADPPGSPLTIQDY